MKVALSKWGNSTSVRIPATYLAALNLKATDQVDIRIEGKSLVLDRVIEDEEVDLDDLLRRLTPDNIHDEVSFGAPLGNEAL